MTRDKAMLWCRSVLRFFQFAFSLVALATVSRGFVGASYYGYSSMLGSRAATYTTLMTYTGMLVGLFFLVELTQFYPRPTPRFVEQLIDLVLAAMLVVAGIVLVVDDYVANCSVYGYMLRCNELKTAVVFSFLASLAFFVSFLVNCCDAFMGSRGHARDESESNGGTGRGPQTGGYHAESTPTGASTPKDLSNRFGSSLVAYIALHTAGITYHTNVQGETVSVLVESGALSFARIVHFLAFVYAFAFVVFIEWLHLCIYPVHYCEKLMDTVALTVLTVASLVLLLSKMTLHCKRGFGQFVQCGDLYLAVTMSFLSTFAFLAIVLIGKRENARERRQGETQDETGDGHAAATSEGYTRAATPVPVVTAAP
ncbi:hypothetical protein PsorP6_013221 [Peronosclerospora sorghi]|uniref:Uncharacterized protein n=1 Tax=Peronosclerospora sorghi TaxID=230839 RepID=A0ACC0WHI6_9STRA|nr:hypothetical protein PsorP6_013221 [Peronosclerospora sorghi]